MNFRYKNFMFQVFERIPCGARLHYFFQKNITKSLGFKENKHFLNAYSEKVSTHLETFEKYGTKKFEESTYYEFGAGWNLLSVLGMSMAGMKDIICVDINPLVHVDEINNTLECYRRNADFLKINAPQIAEHVSPKNVQDILRKYFRITYKAPFDARKTRFPEESIDYMASNVTLEHIPPKDIKLIMQECFRIMRQGGIMSLSIDYQDHWSYFDKSISVYNFLAYENDEWKKYSPSMHYQNRLRHCDYVKIFKETGFTIICENTKEITDEDRAHLKNVSIASCFSKYSEEELLIRSGYFILSRKQ